MIEIKKANIADLKPAEYNPRKLTDEEYIRLKQSVEKFGLVDPILVNENPERMNIVIGGHQRLQIAKDIGMTEVPVVYLNLDETQEKELNVRLNKNTGRWDWDKLANNFDNDVLLGIGFTETELGLVASPEKDEHTLEDTMSSYLDGGIKQIVLYFKNEEYEQIMEDMKRLMDEFQVESHTEVFLKLKELHENN